jgi:KDO2-lipid IV(A) lauroyltransferase
LGAIAYAVSGKRNRVAYANLKAAFCGEKNPSELKRITKNVYRNWAQIFAEMLSMSKMDRKYVEKYLEIPHMERIEMCSKHKGGMILVSAHFGDWEMSIAAGAILGYPVFMLTRDQKMIKTYELLNILRESKGNTVIRKGADVKNLFKVLRAGKGVGLLGDQNAGPNGILTDLFGRPASTAVGPYRMAQKCGSYILPAFIHRKKGPYQKIILEEPFLVAEDEDLKEPAARFNRILEKHIREFPEQWLWMHKKWKMTDLKKVLVLDDGKAGHLKQSMAVVKQIRKYRESEGFSSDKLRVQTLRIKFRNKVSRGCFNALSPYLSCCGQIHLKLLRLFLDKESYDACAGKYADIIISCGSGLCGVNFALKLENSAKNLTVLDPGSSIRGKFDVVIMPEHDLKKYMDIGEKMVVTKLAPNLIDPEEINTKQAGPYLPGKELFQEKTCVGILVGGTNKYYEISKNTSRKLAKGIIEAVEEIEGCFYITTSRRTPEGAESVLREDLENSSRCLNFIAGKNDKDTRTVEKILARSDMLLVSAESISMVSEAVSSGKPVMVFMPDKKSGNMDKYEKFVKRLEKENYLSIVDPLRLKEKVSSIAGKTYNAIRIEDDKKIFDKMYKLF